MHRDAEDAWPGDARDLAERDKIERRAGALEWISGDASHTRCADGCRNVALDYFTSEVVQRIRAIPPSGITRGVGLERIPERAAAVADHHDRASIGIDRRRARNFSDRGIAVIA